MSYAYPPGAGRIEVIAGCMFSGKTEELMRRLRRAEIARLRVQVFKPAKDVRYGADAVVSHDAGRLPCAAVSHAEDVLKYAGDAQVIGIDEAQFFDDGIVGVCERLADEGRRVIAAGLDLDYRGVPFGPIPALMAVAEEVQKALAVCTVCGAPASRSQRLVASESRVLLGAQDRYEARCRRHWDAHRFDAEQQHLPLMSGS